MIQVGNLIFVPLPEGATHLGQVWKKESTLLTYYAPNQSNPTYIQLPENYLLMGTTSQVSENYVLLDQLGFIAEANITNGLFAKEYYKVYLQKHNIPFSAILKSSV